MSVLMVARVPGDPDELAERYWRQQPLIEEEFGGFPDGYLVHACGRAGDGLVIANLVASEEEVRRTRPRFERTAEAVGLPEPEIELYPVVNAVVPSALPPS